MMPERLFSSRRRAAMIGAICALLMLGAFGLASYSFAVAHRNGCESRNKTLDVLADILDRSRPTQAEFAAMPHARRIRVIRFFAFTEQRIREARC